MTTNDRPVILETRGITKRFPKVIANSDVSISLKQGEILSLLGENGAGKSTLMNILYGLYSPTEGEILLNGQPASFTSPKEAIHAGLGMVHQHFMLVETLTVTENIILGTEPGKFGFINYDQAREEVKELSQRYQLEIDPDAKVSTLSVGLQQRVEILKALYRKAKILILDEPTAVLTPQEVDQLFEVIKKLRDSGVSIIIITHKLEEVKDISERVYILRRGKVAGECVTSEVTTSDLANLMVGRDVVLQVHKDPHKVTKEPVIVLKDLKVKSDKGYFAIDGLTLDVRPGEIVGIAGVDGNGQSELAEAIMGLRPTASGEIRYQDGNIAGLSTRERITRRISFVPSDRHHMGLVLPMTVAENTVIGYHDRAPYVHGINLDLERIDADSKQLVKDYDIRTSGVDVPVSQLSGGNQQKVILAREFSREPEFLLVSQPTRGLDVGAIEYIHKRVIEMRDKDVAVLLISLELEEIFSLADRILVLYEGKIVKELDPTQSNEKEVGFYMTGGKEK